MLTINGKAELVDCLYSPEQLPYRCPLARKAAEAKREIRCLLFGNRKHAYRILYEVDEARQKVWILHIRHGTLRDLAMTYWAPGRRSEERIQENYTQRTVHLRRSALRGILYAPFFLKLGVTPTTRHNPKYYRGVLRNIVAF